MQDSAAQMTNLWVTGTRWDKSKYLQCSGSSISRLVTVNILAMSQWNVSCDYFVDLSLAECEADMTAGKLWRPDLKLLVWHSHRLARWDQLCGLPATWSWDQGIPAGSVEGWWKKGAAVNQRVQPKPPVLCWKVTSEAVSWLSGVRKPSPSDSPQRECNCKIKAWRYLMASRYGAAI